MEAYIKEAVPSGFLFQTGTGKKISTRFLRSLVAQVAKKSGVERLHCHLLRHSFGTDLFRKTKNLVLVQQALGHASIQTTTIYTHISNPELEEALKNLRT
jgi:integrase/recombinase XerD